MSASAKTGNYLNREESFMYDREARFPMEDTMNAARIEYTEKGVMHLTARRCDVLKISMSSAVLGIITMFDLPRQFYLDIPDARITKIGCTLMKTFINNTAAVAVFLFPVLAGVAAVLLILIVLVFVVAL